MPRNKSDSNRDNALSKSSLTNETLVASKTNYSNLIDDVNVLLHD